MTCRPQKENQQVEWTLWDVMELELRLEQDAAHYEQELSPSEQRWRDTMADSDLPPRRDVFFSWLGMKRDGNPQSDLLHTARQSFRLLQFFLGVAGALVGAVVAAGLLNYTGKQLINVFWYLLVLVVLPSVWLLVRAAGGLLGRLAHARIASLNTDIADVLRMLWSNLEKRLRGQQVGQAEEVAGIVRSKVRLYPELSIIPPLRLVCWIGVWAAVGAVVATIVFVLFRQLEFGWETTVLKSEQVAAMVRVLATPWAWLAGEGVGYPSAEQVEFSRISLKKGAAASSVQFTTQWWGFLVGCVLTYSLLPRFFIWVGLGFRQSRLLRELRFEHAVCDAKWRQWRFGEVQYSEQPEEALKGDSADNTDPSFVEGALVDGSYKLILSEDLSGAIDVSALEKALAQSLSLHLSEDSPNVCRVQEAWAPPTREILDELGVHVQKNPEARIVVALVGFPAKTAVGVGEAEQADVDMWRSRVRKLGEPAIQVQKLGLSQGGEP